MRVLLALAIVLCPSAALAVCPSPLTGKDAAGTTQNFGITVDGAGSCYGNAAIVDGTNAANKAGVPGSAGDGTSNATPGLMTYGFGFVFNGTTWDRLKGDATNGIFANIKVLPALPTGGNTIGAVNQAGAPWAENITQFGGNNVATGTGASGVGIPRVTVANDSNILATQSGTWTVQQGTPPWAQNLTQINGVALGSPSNYGTSPGAVSVAGVNAFITNAPSVTQSGTWTVQQGGAPWSVSQSGAWTVQQGGAPWSVSQSGTWSVAVTSLPAVAQSGGPWTQNLTQFGGWPVLTGIGPSGLGIPRVSLSSDSIVGQAGTWNLNNIAGTISLPTGAATAANQTNASAKTQIVDGSGNVIASTSNALNVSASGTVTANQGGAPWSENITQFGGVNISTGTGASGTGIPRVTVSNDSNVLATQSGTWTVQPGNTANTTPWLTSIVGGGNTASVNASNQLAVNCANCTGSGVSQQDATGFTLGSGNMVPIGGAYNSAPSGLTSGQAGVALLTQGRILQANPRNSAGQEIGTALRGAASIPIAVAQAPTSLAGVPLLSPTDAFGQPRTASWITDGTDYAAVTPSGKPTRTTDSALVTALSPNSPLPTGTNSIGGVAATQSGTWNDNATLKNSVGQEVGSVLPSTYSPPLQVNIASKVTNQNPLLQPTDPYGGLRTAAWLTDGSHYVGIATPAKPVAASDGALVTVPSPAPSLQCPLIATVNQTANTRLVANPGGKSIHVCAVVLVVAAAQSLSLVEGTGSTCGTGTFGMIGGTSASVSVAANSGWVVGSDRIMVPMQARGDDLCLLQSASNNTSGMVSYGIY